MKFKSEAIVVKGRTLDVLDGLSDAKYLPPQLNLKLRDLEETLRNIREEYGNTTLLNNAIINNGTRIKLNMFTAPAPHMRSMFSHNERLSQRQKGKEVMGIKGSGLSNWRISQENKITEGSKEIRFPIFKTGSSLDTQKIYGGNTQFFACLEFINSLILNSLTQRHNLESAIYKPLQVVSPEELPIQIDGQLNIVGAEEYCNFSSDKALNTEEFRRLAQIHYVGEKVDLRIPPSSFKSDLFDQGIELSWRVNYAGKLSKYFKDGWSVVGPISEKLARLAKIVHSYNGTFSRGSPLSSSLMARNISVRGVVCDLDTVNFHNYGEDIRDYWQKADLLSAMRAVSGFGDVLEFDKSKERAEYDFDKIGSIEQTYSSPLAKIAMDRFFEIYSETKV